MAPIPVLELDTFVWSSVGTSLAIASANTFNQVTSLVFSTLYNTFITLHFTRVLKADSVCE